MSVYFARVGDYVKVGCSFSLHTRLPRLLSRSNLAKPNDLNLDAPVELLRLIRGGFTQEREIQKQLAEHRACGEWFHAAPEVLAFIATTGPEMPLPTPQATRRRRRRRRVA